MDILILGQQNWDVCWTAKQQIATRLAERGHRVLYVDPVPARPGDEPESAMEPGGVPGLRRIGPRDLWIYTYVPVPALGWRLNRLRFPRMAPKVLRATGFHAPVALCLHPSMLLWMERARCRARVYYAVDEYTAYGEMPEAERVEIRALENEVLDRAEVVLSLSPRLHGRFSERNRASFLLENGADTEHYQPERLARVPVHPEVDRLPGPRVGFFGQVDGRLDQDLVTALARRRRDWQFVLAGRVKGMDPSRLTAEPNIHLLGYQRYEVLPNIAAGIDAWIVPYLQNELTHSCNPLKVFEYLATGRPVVSTPLEGLVTCREAVEPALGPDAFLDALARVLADPEAGRTARLGLAAANTWYERVERIEGYLRLAVDRARRAPDVRSSERELVTARHASRMRRGRHYVNEHGQIRPPSTGRLQRAAWAGIRALGWAFYAGRIAGRAAERRGPVAVRSILVVRQGYLGDFIAIMPALAALRRACPEARITLGVQHDMNCRALFEHCPDIDDVIDIDFLATPGRLGHLRGLARLFARGFDLVIAGGEPFAIAEGHLTGAPRYAGLYDGFPDQEIQGRLMQRDLGRHEADNNLALIEAVTGALASDEERMPELTLPEDALAERFRALAQALGLPPEPSSGGRLLIVHPGSQRATRRWPADRLALTAARLMDRLPDLTVVLTGTPGERALVEEVERHLPAALAPRLRSAVGRTDLLGLVALLDRADGVLCNDTGIMHLARTRGAPLVALLGPENPEVWGPYPVGRAPAVALRREVPCAPCRLDACAAHHCMRSLPAAEVEAQVVRLLETGRRREHAGAALHPVEWHTRRLTWGDLGRAGGALPLVTVVVFAERDRPFEDTLARVLPEIERQTYPNIEVLGVLRPESPAWTDGRSPERRFALPIRTARAVVPWGAEGWQAAALQAHGQLVTSIRPGSRWWPVHVGLDVAAAHRAPDLPFFREGRPVERFDREWGTALRDALVRLTVEVETAGDSRSAAGRESGSGRDRWGVIPTVPEGLGQLKSG